jgi:hypothetical protein
MNYFLYDVIEKAADDYRLATRDQRLFCLKFGAIDPWARDTAG